MWNERINIFFESIGFRWCQLDHSVYTLSTGNHNGAFISLYVDDLLIFVKDMLVINKVKEAFSHEFKMKDLNEIEYCIGIQIIR